MLPKPHLKAISRRWENAPYLFISEKINKRINKLIELYNEAAKCYIFGLNVAAVAMCRALLEYILIQYYKIEEDNLKRIISSAEKRYNRLKKLNLDKLRSEGNDVMHKYETREYLEESAVIEYLSTIRELVHMIPDPKK